VAAGLPTILHAGDRVTSVDLAQRGHTAAGEPLREPAPALVWLCPRDACGTRKEGR
jgi:hypothetical protein